ncbi:phenylalanine--tRNA ligase subunit beta [Ramlibacter tataouinensis]|uniref:Phenylalanine--tRNA ligase beta subunit n=1 Tax=Ramlibacter tataouinensis (strain ATCC BAA-407 / DSM 14655 / LMG 21543 / TTB310) TaxID=365046 RepID=F5XVV9_RAMTT|nr:phenylalanine--tRNA ligase subunit beta [Ramlibacter tataouinensis]AEG92872.1 candidate phenylalanyl-tRNA synthetase beta subunit(Phenylalanine--tRNA ligase alpha subuniit) [Ramlibacter tataouinensis TTB310]
MQFPESWLRAFCNPPLSTQQIADVLTMGGMEVEDLRPVAPPFTQVVVGEIKEAVQHPNADRLRVCQVDVGQGRLLNIVCGAPNARAGIKVPTALVGAELPPGEDGKPFAIKLGKLRGVESQGMLCSARELKLSEDHGGLLELAADAPVGKSLREVLNLDDHVFTLKLTPNLAHALSVYGVARELSALTGAPLREPKFEPVPPCHDARLKVRLNAPDLCGRFSGRIIRNVDTRAKTPQWMVDRLAGCGQRSVTALVDISNYVMFEFGRPSHIFDHDKIHGALDVRWGRPGEKLRLLNGSTIEVDGRVGVIADDVQVESLAGIMGGDATAVSDDTRNVYVEAAFWWPEAVQGRSRRYNFSTDAGHRFERGVDPSTTVEHIEHVTRLILDICGGEAGPLDDQVARLPQRKPVQLRVARAARVIGMAVTERQCLDAFARLRLPAQADNGVVTVTPPPYRFDLAIEEDLVEEVARIVGYERLPTTPPLAPITAKLPPESRRSRFALRRLLAALGYQETINFSFVEAAWERDLAGNADPVRLLNPIASQMSVMRSSLLGSLLQVLKFNLDRKADRVRIFEVGRVFRRDASVATTDTTVRGVHQPMHLAGLAFGAAEGLQWGRKEQGAVDFFDVKGDVEALLSPRRAEFRPGEHPALHPGRCATIWLDGRQVGVLGELHPRWRQGWELPEPAVLFEIDLEAASQRPVPAFRGVPRVQPVERDIAIVVRDDVSHADLMRAIHGAQAGGLLRQALLFDVYKPRQAAAGLAANEKSLAVRLTLGGMEATLTDAQIEAAVQSVIDRIAREVGGRLRS